MISLERANGQEPEKQDPKVEDKGLIDEREKVVDEGRIEKAFEIAQNMKREGLDLALIAKMTGLLPSEIERLD